MNIMDKQLETPEQIINFGGGPAKLPREVLEEVQKELLNYNGCGISIMEMSHRSAVYDQIHNETISLFKELLNVPENYKILFLHGGGRGAFSSIALNLIPVDGEADYIVTGSWSKIAAQDAENLVKVNYVLPPRKLGDDVPDQSTWKLNPKASYLYYCANETIEGLEFPFIPEVEGVPLVCDMSSNILTKEIDVSKFGVIFFASQKNVGPAGVAVIIIREDLVGTKRSKCPPFLDFSLLAKTNSILNTPSTFTIYVCGKVLKYLKKEGGVKAVEKSSKIKSEILYNLIDDSQGFYRNEIHPNCRSRVNVTFRIKGGEKAEAKFLQVAKQAGLIELKGHRSVGGIRASLYTAVTVEEVAKLAGFMRLFESEYAFDNTEKDS